MDGKKIGIVIASVVTAGLLGFVGYKIYQKIVSDSSDKENKDQDKSKDTNNKTLTKPKVTVATGILESEQKPITSPTIGKTAKAKNDGVNVYNPATSGSFLTSAKPITLYKTAKAGEWIGTVKDINGEWYVMENGKQVLMSAVNLS